MSHMQESSDKDFLLAKLDELEARSDSLFTNEQRQKACILSGEFLRLEASCSSSEELLEKYEILQREISLMPESEMRLKYPAYY